MNYPHDMSFGELLKIKDFVTVTELAEWTGFTRQMIYKYINGKVHPDRLSYNFVIDVAQYLDVDDIIVYNSLVESFERVHEYDEEKGEWV